MPPNLSLSIGGREDLKLEDMIASVKRQDEIGRKLVDIQLSYLRSFDQSPVEKERDAVTHNSS